jgi:DNA-binding beta-propeller fold protein YncE
MLDRRLCKALLFVAFLVVLAGPASTAAAKDYIFVPVSNALQIIDCESDTVVKTVPAYNDYIVNSAPSADGKRYYLNAFHTIYVFDTAAHQLVDAYRLSAELNKVTVLGFAVSEDGKKLYLSTSIVKKKQNVPKLDVLPPQLLIFDMATKQVTGTFEIPYCVTGVVALRNDPDKILLIGLDIHALNLKDGKLELVMPLLNVPKDAEPANSLVIWNSMSPGDHGLFTNPYYTPSGMAYLVIDRNTGKVSSLKGETMHLEYSTVVSPDKKYLYGVMDDLIKVDMETGKTIKAVPVERGTSYAVSITSDGKKVYVGPAGPEISVYDAESLNRLGVIPLEADGVVAHRISMAQ